MHLTTDQEVRGSNPFGFTLRLKQLRPNKDVAAFLFAHDEYDQCISNFLKKLSIG